MGDSQSSVHVDSDRLISRRHKEAYKIIFKDAKKECKNIRRLCKQNEDLKTLFMKLTILESETFTSVKYLSRCGHPKCNQRAPQSFPESDVFVCNTHLQETHRVFKKDPHQKSIQSQMEKIRKNGTRTQKKVIEAMYQSFTEVGTSLGDGSIQIVTKQPKLYWPSLMTKLIVTADYMALSPGKSNATAHVVVKKLIELMILYRFVMNPIGAEILVFVSRCAVHLTHILSASLVNAVHGMVSAMLNTLLTGYGIPFVGYVVAAVRNIPNDVLAASSIAVGSTSVLTGTGIGIGTAVTTGAAVTTAAAETGSVAAGVAVAGGISGATVAAVAAPIVIGGLLITAGVVYLVKHNRNNQNPQAHQVVAAIGQNITHLNTAAGPQLQQAYLQITGGNIDDSSSDDDDDDQKSN
eukprot:442683_1